MLKTTNYIKFNDFKPISLDGLYQGEKTVLDNLRYNIKMIIEIEAPITLNTLKARLREAFDVKKISQKALDIITDIIDDFRVLVTENYYDIVLWPERGIYNIEYLRVNSNFQIYDIAYQELKLLVNHLGLVGEELYRAILSYYGYEVLTEKARNYLMFVERESKK